MSRRTLLTEEERRSLFGVPVDRASLAKHYTLGPDDIALLDSKRTERNRLGAAVWLALLRHPGFGLRLDEPVPPELVAYLADQVGADPLSFADYGSRSQTRLEHGWEAIRHLGLRAFEAGNVEQTIAIAAEIARATDKGLAIATAIVAGLRDDSIVLPAPARIERIGIVGRARARRLAADTIVDALTPEQIAAIDALLAVDPAIGITRLAWLRGAADAPSARNLAGILERLGAVRRIGLDPNMADRVHAHRFRQLVREGAVAPAFLLSDYSERRRRATITAQLIDLERHLADAAITMFNKQTGLLFARAKARGKRRYEASAADVGRLMRTFGATIAAIAEAHEAGSDALAAIEERVGVATLLTLRPKVDELASFAEEDPLVRAADKYLSLRRYAPAFLEAFSFKGGNRDAALAAVDLLRDLNRTGKRDVPATAPMPFSKAWKKLVQRPDGTIDRRLYETATVATVRDRLNSGDLWVDRTRNYQPFDAYLLPRSEVPPIAVALKLPTTAETYLDERRRMLDWRLRRFASALRRDSLEGVRMIGGKLRVTPLAAAVPPEAERLDAAVDGLMPVVRITELLAEVARRTGFLSRFVELRSGKTHPNPEALLAAILADATNLGIERMANASQGVSYAQLAWTHAWYLSEENYAAALACLVDAQAGLPLASVWGDGTKSSSDGQFFRAGKRGSTGDINAKYGSEPGHKIYSWVSDRYPPFHAKLISATAAEAPHILDGLLYHGSKLEIREHYTDTAGAIDHVFALCRLLGFRFVPRIRDLADRRIGCFEPAVRYGAAAPLIGRPINNAIVSECWDDVVRLTASLHARTVAPSTMLGKLAGHRRQNRLDFALQELGRIERAFFTLDWLESPVLRRRCQATLNKGESEHALEAAIFAHRQGRMADRSLENQAYRASGLTLVTAAIVYWNTLYMGRAVEHLRASGSPAPDAMLTHVSPLGWRHISLTGDYLWQLAGKSGDGYCELNLPRVRQRAAG